MEGKGGLSDIQLLESKLLIWLFSGWHLLEKGLGLRVAEIKK